MPAHSSAPCHLVPPNLMGVWHVSSSRTRPTHISGRIGNRFLNSGRIGNRISDSGRIGNIPLFLRALRHNFAEPLHAALYPPRAPWLHFEFRQNRQPLAPLFAQAAGVAFPFGTAQFANGGECGKLWEIEVEVR